MSQEKLPTTRLVQIEPRRKPIPSSTDDLPLQLPVLTDGQIYRKKAQIAFRKLAAFTYSRHSYAATQRWFMAQILPARILYRWKPYQRGECNRCGLCCKIIHRCPFFYENGTTTACLIYKSEKHWPAACVAFPSDPADLAEVQREIAPAPCPFHYEGQPEHPTVWGAVKAEIRTEWGKRVNKLKEAFDF